jgi:hypothetical protein
MIDHQATQQNQSAYSLCIGLISPLAVKNTGEHSHALSGKGHWLEARAVPT